MKGNSVFEDYTQEKAFFPQDSFFLGKVQRGGFFLIPNQVPLKIMSFYVYG